MIGTVGCARHSSAETQAPTQSRSHADEIKQAVQEHLDKAEKTIELIVTGLSNGKIEKVEPTGATIKDVRQLSPEDAEAELIRQRLVAVERSLSNIAKSMSHEKDGVGSNCYWKEECTYWYCTKWGSTGNGGTAKCLEYACGATEWKWVCD